MLLQTTLTKFRGSHKYKRKQYITKQTTTNNNSKNPEPKQQQEGNSLEEERVEWDWEKDEEGQWV